MPNWKYAARSSQIRRSSSCPMKTPPALRVTARADRRLAVSGQLQAKLLNAKLEIRGALKSDQALFILPDENTPSPARDGARRPTSGGFGPASGKTTECQTGNTRRAQVRSGALHPAR